MGVQVFRWLRWTGLARLAFVLCVCVVLPSVAYAHGGSHGAAHPDEPIADEAPARATGGQSGSVQVAQAPCRGGAGHSCGCHGFWCARTGTHDFAAVATAGYAEPVPPAGAGSPVAFEAPPAPARLPYFTRAPPVSLI